MHDISNLKRFLLTGCALVMLAGAPALAQNQKGTVEEVAALTQEYDQAVERGDLQRALDAQQEALKLWNTLDPQEKAKLNRENPGMFRWLQGGAAYDNDAVTRRRAARAYRRR